MYSIIVIIKSSRLRTSAGYRRIIAHLSNGEDNEVVIKISGEASDVRDWYEDASRFNRTYAVRHWIIASLEDLSEEKIASSFKSIAKEFCFDLQIALIREHTKTRAVVEASTRHWHLLVPEVDPVTGKVMSSSRDFIRHEKLARTMEFEWGLRPNAGAHNLAVVRALQAEGRVDVATWMQRTFPASGPKPREGVPTVVHRIRQREGIDAAIARVNVRAAWEESYDRPSFEARLAHHGLRIRVGDRRWIIETLDGQLVGRAQPLIGAPAAAFKERMYNGVDTAGVRRRTGPGREPGDTTPRPGGALRPGGPDRNGSRSYKHGDDGRPVAVDARDDRRSPPSERGNIVDRNRSRDEAAHSLLNAAKHLSRASNAQRNAISVLASEARLLGRPAVERIQEALTERERDAEAAIALSRFHQVHPLPDPPAIEVLRAGLKKAKVALDATRTARINAESDLENHATRRPGWWGIATGARDAYAIETSRLRASLSQATEIEKHADLAWTTARNTLDVAVSRRKPHAIEELRRLHIAAEMAQAELPILEKARQVLRGAPQLAYHGLPAVMTSARRLHDGNGVARQDQWGIGLLEPASWTLTHS